MAAKAAPTSYVVALAAMAAVAIAAGVLVAPAQDGLTWAFTAGGAAALAVVQRLSIPIRAKREHMLVSLDECAVLLALALLPVGLVPAMVAAGTAASQLVSRRMGLKMTYNVAAYSLSGAVAALAAGAMGSTGLHPLAGAFVGVALYSLASNAISSMLFARLEGASAVALFRSRFLLPALMQMGIGTIAGTVMFALWTINPWMLVLVLPLGVLVRGYARMVANEGDRGESIQRLADAAQGIGASQGAETAAARLLEACGDIFPAGRATLELDVHGERKRWSRDFESGPMPGMRAIEAPIRDAEGREIGTLRVETARKTRLSLTDADAASARLLAAAVGPALARG